MDKRKEIPRGLCQCGCGGKTNIAPRNNKDRGWIKGEPQRFISAHTSIVAKPKNQEELNRKQRERFAKRKDKGLCVSCLRKAVKGRIHCKRCAAKANAAEKFRMKNPKHHKKALLRTKLWKNDLRKQVIAGYGGKCTCCGETIPEFLTLDHKKNDGALHRSKEGSASYGPTLYLRLIREGFPKKQFQLHCWNCNCAKGIFGGVCPHKRKKNAKPKGTRRS
jgi:hypothetical protein